MPPKGWRKNSEGAYPATTKERDLISIEDMLFPKATVNKLAKAILPEGSLISKDSSTAIQRSATVFVNYLLVHARQNAKKYDRKTIGPQDIISALEMAEFSSFIPAVQQDLDAFQAHKDAVRLKRREEKLAKEQEETVGVETATETAAVEVGESADQEAEEETKIVEAEGPVAKKVREDTVSEVEN